MKYLLGTAMLVELLRPEPAPSVLHWYRRHYRKGLGVSALTLTALYGGVAAVEHLSGQFQSHVARINSLIMHRTNQFDTAYQSALNHSAARASGGVTAARTGRAPSAAGSGPICRPTSPLSLAMAPTRSPGRTPPLRPRPTNR